MKSGRDAIVMIAFLVGAVAMSTPSAASATAQAYDPHETNAPEAAATFDCGASFDTYQVSADYLAACGIRSYPLLSVTLLPDGGHSYHYNVEGYETWSNVPPPSFDASKADTATLAIYGIPSTPLPGFDQQTWSAKLAQMSFTVPPPALHAIPYVSATSVNNDHWSGYVAKNATFNYAAATWTEPTVSGCSGGDAAVFWAGIGGYAGDQHLGQNGTAVHVPAMGLGQAWWEILPEIGTIQPVNFSASSGFGFTARTSHLSGNTYQFFWYNYHTDQSLTINQTHNGYSGLTAESIVERPLFQDGFHKLTNFGTIPFSGTANDNPISNYSYDRITMVNGNGVPLDVVGTLDPDGKSFRVTWQRCS